MMQKVYPNPAKIVGLKRDKIARRVGKKTSVKN